MSNIYKLEKIKSNHQTFMSAVFRGEMRERHYFVIAHLRKYNTLSNSHRVRPRSNKKEIKVKRPVTKKMGSKHGFGKAKDIEHELFDRI